MSYPNDPYRQGGQPNWPGAHGSGMVPGQPDLDRDVEQNQQSDDDGERTTRYRPDAYPQQPDQYQRHDPFQAHPYQPNPQQQGPYQHDPYQTPYQGSYQQSPFQQGPIQQDPNQGYQQPGAYQGSYQPPGPYQTGPQPAQQPGQQPGQQTGQPGPFGQLQPSPGGWPTQEPTAQYDYSAPPPVPPGPPYQQLGPEQPQPKKRTALMVGSIVAVIALVAAGVATYFFAFRGTTTGAATPKEAAVSLVNALSKNDMVGLLDGLAPAEGAVAKDYMTETFNELKRLEVVKSEARPEQINGVTFKAEELVFDEANEEKVNDHLTITKLVDGKLTISSDWSQLPLTEKFLTKAFPGGLPKNQTQTIDVGDEIAKNRGKPVRIATVQVDNQWYPSLYYSIADAALQSEGKKWPAQAIAANGADSPENAVKQLAEAALQGDIKRLIELTPPDEMSALHDAGQLVIDAAKDATPSGAKLIDLQTKVSDITGGKRVSLAKLTIEDPSGATVSVEVSGECLKVDSDGKQQQLCGKDMAEAVAQYAEVGGTTLTAAELGAIERATVGYLQSGLVTTQVDGKWYVSPSRSLGDLSLGFLRKLQPGDLETLLDMVN